MRRVSGLNRDVVQRRRFDRGATSAIQTGPRPGADRGNTPGDPNAGIAPAGTPSPEADAAIRAGLTGAAQNAGRAAAGAASAGREPPRVQWTNGRPSVVGGGGPGQVTSAGFDPAAPYGLDSNGSPIRGPGNESETDQALQRIFGDYEKYLPSKDESPQAKALYESQLGRERAIAEQDRAQQADRLGSVLAGSGLAGSGVAAASVQDLERQAGQSKQDIAQHIGETRLAAGMQRETAYNQARFSLGSAMAAARERGVTSDNVFDKNKRAALFNKKLNRKHFADYLGPILGMGAQIGLGLLGGGPAGAVAAGVGAAASQGYGEGQNTQGSPYSQPWG